LLTLFDRFIAVPRIYRAAVSETQLTYSTILIFRIFYMQGSSKWVKSTSESCRLFSSCFNAVFFGSSGLSVLLKS